VLGWNLLQAATDWIGVTQGMVRVGPLWVAKGLSRWAGDAVRMENTAGWIYERSEFMRLRGKTQMRELYEIRNSLAGQGRLADLADFGLDAVTAGRIDLQDVKDSYWWFMSRVQKLQDIPTWLGAYEKAMAQMKAENGRPASEFERSAIEAADQAVRESFSHGQIGSLPGILRGGPVKKLWTTFYSFANATLNNAVLSVRRFRQAPYSFSSTGRLASDMALLYIAPAALATAVYTLLSSEHKNEDELKEALVKQEVGYLMGSVPLLRELSGSIQGRDYQGPAGARFFAQAGRAVKAAAKGEADWKDLNSAAGVFFHYPANQVNRIIQAIASEGGNPLSRLFGQR